MHDGRRRRSIGGQRLRINAKKACALANLQVGVAKPARVVWAQPFLQTEVLMHPVWTRPWRPTCVAAQHVAALGNEIITRERLRHKPLDMAKGGHAPTDGVAENDFLTRLFDSSLQRDRQIIGERQATGRRFASVATARPGRMCGERKRSKAAAKRRVSLGHGPCGLGVKALASTANQPIEAVAQCA